MLSGSDCLSMYIIHTDGRLYEWIAEEKGYCAAEELTNFPLEKNRLGAGLTDPAFVTDEVRKLGAYESDEAGRESTTRCARHWTVNMAASAEHGTLWGNCYFVTPLRYGFLPQTFDAANIHARGVI